jgi:hypothetical protein
VARVATSGQVLSSSDSLAKILKVTAYRAMYLSGKFQVTVSERTPILRRILFGAVLTHRDETIWDSGNKHCSKNNHSIRFKGLFLRVSST